MNQAVMEFLAKGYTPSPKKLKYVKEDGSIGHINALPDNYTDDEIEFGEVFVRYFYDLCGGDVEKTAEFIASIPEDKTLHDVAEMIQGIMAAELMLKNSAKTKRPPSE